MQGYAGEEKRLWEEFRYGVVMGTRQFVEKVRAKYVSERPHPEVPQQKGLVGRLDIGEFFEKASQLLDVDVDRIKGSVGVYGFFFEAQAGDLLSGKLYVSSPHIRIPHIQLAPPHLSFHY